MTRQKRIMMNTGESYRLRFTMKTDPKKEDAEVLIYSEIADEQYCGNETTPKDFDKALKAAKEAGAKRLNIRINSGGGEVYAAIAMRSMIINAGFESVRVMVEGLCASAATLFVTIPEAHVVIADGSEFMIHNPRTIAVGNAAELEETVEHLHKMEEQFREMYAARTGKSADQIKSWMDATTWFTAKEAVDNGFCDERFETEKAVASVSPKNMTLMKRICGDIPGQITERVSEEKPEDEVGNGCPQSGKPSHTDTEKKEEQTMGLKDLTLEQLRDGNPDLFRQIQDEVVKREHERLSDIDALTMPGYEDLAEKAKADGTSAIDFQKEVVAAMKQKGHDFLDARKTETAAAKAVHGEAAETRLETEEQAIKSNADDMAHYASEYVANGDNGMF